MYNAFIMYQKRNNTFNPVCKWIKLVLDTVGHVCWRHCKILVRRNVLHIMASNSMGPCNIFQLVWKIYDVFFDSSWSMVVFHSSAPADVRLDDDSTDISVFFWVDHAFKQACKMNA